MDIDARKRNLLIKIVKWAIENNSKSDERVEVLNNTFSKEYLKANLYFKTADINDYYDKLFNKGKLNKDIKKQLIDYLRYHEENIACDSEPLKNIYNELSGMFENYHNNKENIEKTLKEAVEIAIKLHWKYLPIYMEQYITNNGYIPEEKPEVYYYHFHAIEDLYRYIYTDNKVEWKSIDGDINLDIDMTFKIYTTRWQHYDYYSIRRTSIGWSLSGLPAGTGECKKDGNGALTNALRHDSVCYPKDGLNYAMELLWNEADTTEMKLETLQSRLDDISEWIKAVEIATHESQPKWCGYY